jgi:hypothetical protein
VWAASQHHVLPASAAYAHIPPESVSLQPLKAPFPEHPVPLMKNCMELGRTLLAMQLNTKNTDNSNNIARTGDLLPSRENLKHETKLKLKEDGGNGI